jgi:hypothetical protein
MKQKLIEKFGKKFAALDKGATPILQGIHYAADGTVFITDRHIGLRIRDAHNFKEPMTLHAKTGQPIVGVYPDLTRVMVAGNRSEVITLASSSLSTVADRVRCIADVASRLNKKRPVVTIEAANGSAWVHVKDADSLVQAKVFLGNTDDPKLQLEVSLNAEYLHTALSLFASAGISKLHMSFKGPLNPIYLSDGRDIDVVILPYRINH